MVDAGVDARTAASITGHSVAVMWKYYRQATPEGRKAAVKRAKLGTLVKLPKRRKGGS
jgi:hypothetical protein